jgi:hypothetical protein
MVANIYALIKDEISIYSGTIRQQISRSRKSVERIMSMNEGYGVKNLAILFPPS